MRMSKSSLLCQLLVKHGCFLNCCTQPTRGYYFTIQTSSRDFGAFDLGACRIYSDYNPEGAQRAIQLLYFVRVTVCNYLISKGFGEPQFILLAQLHPVSFFGVDVFELLFTALVKDHAFNPTDIIDPFPLVAIDEIQVTLRGDALHFSPLVYYSKLQNLFPQFFLSGTDFNFDFLKETCILKEKMTSYEVASGFGPLSKGQIQRYATKFLTDQKVEGVVQIVPKIIAFELCHGRPRFLAFILDCYIGARDIEVAFSKFFGGISP
jgi:hypothetical protein